MQRKHALRQSGQGAYQVEIMFRLKSRVPCEETITKTKANVPWENLGFKRRGR